MEPFKKFRQTSARRRKGDSRNRASRRAALGITLLEVGLSIAIMSILSLAISNMLVAAFESQRSYKLHEYEQTIAMDVVDALRTDLRLATQVSVTNGGNTLSFNTFDINQGTDVAVTYNFDGTTLKRTAKGNTRDFSQGYNAPLKVFCEAPAGGGSACFQSWSQTAGGPVKRVTLYNLRIKDNVPGNTAIDREFGKSEFRLSETSFDIMDATRFQ